MNILAVILVTIIALFICVFVVFKQQSNKIKNLTMELQNQCESMSYSYSTDVKKKPDNFEALNISENTSFFGNIMDNKLFKLTTSAMAPLITMIAFETPSAKITEIVEDECDVELQNQLKMLEEL